MKKIAFVVVEDGILRSLSVLSRCLVSHAVSNLLDGHFQHVFILTQSSENRRTAKVLRNDFLYSLPEKEKVTICEDNMEYIKIFLEFLITLQQKELIVRILGKPGVKQLIEEKINLHSDELKDRGVVSLPRVFIF